MNVHRQSKKQATKLLPITSPMLIDFQNSFKDRLSGKFATNVSKYPTTTDVCRYTTL